MSETTEKQTTKKTPKNKKSSPSTIATIVAFVAIFIVLGFLIITKDSRLGDTDQAEKSQLENKVDVVETEDKKDLEDENKDLMEEEEETVLGEEDEATEEEEIYYPDLYIHEYTFSEDEPMQNEEITVHIEIVNQGDVDVEEFHWEWWADTDSLECDGDIDWLDVGEKETVECEYTYDDYGAFETRVVIDSEDSVDESDEYNNVEERDVDVFEELYVDLSIGDYFFSTEPKKGVTFTINIEIKNEGNIAAEDFYWEWWGTLYNYATGCRGWIGTLSPNSELFVECDYMYGGTGSYGTKAVVDADGTVEESNEDNNEYPEKIKVTDF